MRNFRRFRHLSEQSNIFFVFKNISKFRRVQFSFSAVKNTIQIKKIIEGNINTILKRKDEALHGVVIDRVSFVCFRRTELFH